jgi:cupin fold WbuC family metalloprotein
MGAQGHNVAMNSFERLSPFATISRHDKALGVSAHVIASKISDARANPRQREILALHRTESEPIQRMINALEPGSYIRPHRHHDPPKAECIVLLTGALGFVTFHNDGTPDIGHCFLLHRTKGMLAVDVRENLWHTFFALERGTTVFEVKAGPFDARRDKQAAPWAPPEDSPEAPGYLTSLEEIFRTRL